MEILIHGDDIEKGIRDLKRMLARDGIIQELKEWDRGHKKSDRRKFKEHKALARRLKKNFKSG